MPQSRRVPWASIFVADIIDHRVEVGRAFGEGRALRSDIGVVEAEERLAEDREKVESGVGLGTRRSRWSSPNQGRSKVWPPNGSPPGQAKLCHQATEKRRWSSSRLPITSQSGS